MYKLYGTAGTKMLNMLILEVLKDYSDENHPLTQQEILRRLKIDYDLEKVDRRSVRANVESLIDMGYDIETVNAKGYYLASREFEEAELRMLIDAVLFSKTLSGNQAKKLITKLENQANTYFESKISHVKPTPVLARTENKNVLYNVNSINDAIDRKRKISFRYSKYGTDMKPHDTGHLYIMNPYQMVASNGQYYLLGNVDKYNDVSYYRIDKMTDVVILDEKIKPQKNVEGLGEQLNLSKHMAEHIYMFCGESDYVKIKTSTRMVDVLVDWFGKDFLIVDKSEESMVIRVKCNLNAMFYWALQYGPAVEVLEPAGLRQEIAQAVADMNRKYNG